ncbi:MAG TPA: glycosyltransferase [Vicinamibacterales bacterium]|nr:glycosyltransferase [Vicinamibacterales bacterium]
MISFVVPAYNEERMLGRTLASIHAAARAIGLPYEIVVADDSSTDATGAIAEAHGARVIAVAHRQIAATRNAGARAAAGEILIFVDADTIVNADVVEATIAAIERGAAGGGAAFRLDGRIPWHGRLLAVVVAGAMRMGRLAAGCYLFCTRTAFEAVGGFDERLFATEEIALSRALARHGRMVILRVSVETSGRKLRTHSGWEILRVISALLSSGAGAVRSRRHLDIWYGARRVDPEAGG